ncbi:olfactory receptor 6N2-like [Latimeria chalumnae]|uniref:olfactory receptor 6N2-like n=1 Tax=Latimeria chalumnae TaxID=7897 RepID=UPI00313D2010
MQVQSIQRISTNSPPTNVSTSSTEQVAGFYLMGFSQLKNTSYLFVFLSIVYVITLLGNFVLMSLIYLVQNLHTPRYVAVFNLAVVDVLYNTAYIPQMINTFLFKSNFIGFKTCFSQMFFGHYFASIECFSLAVMANDRLLAICFPLRYPSLNTNAKILLIIAMCWICLILPTLFVIILASRLSYCASTEVYSCFCEHGPIYRIACGDTSLNAKLGLLVGSIILYGPFAFIIVTYAVIAVAVIKIASAEKRRKAVSTCISHLILVLIFFVPIMVTYMLGALGVKHSLDTRNLCIVLSNTLPPMLNPIIYSLKTEEI